MPILGTRGPVRHRIVFVALWLATLALLASLAGIPVRADSDPVIVIYPLVAMGDLGDPEAGGRFANIMAINMEREGGVVIKPFAPGTDRKNYLTAARAEGADYYVTGFLTPIGAEVTLVVQVVSVDSGTVMWSQTAFVKTFNDAGAQASAVRHAILAREGRYLAEIDAPTPAPHDTTQPGKKANETTGFSLLGHHHAHREATPAPAASASPAAVSPALGIAVPGAPGPLFPPASTPSPGPSGLSPVATVAPAPVRPVTSVVYTKPDSRTPAPPRATAPAPPRTRPPSTPPPAFGRGSGFSSLRTSVVRSPQTTALLRRFAPTGASLASLEGVGDTTERAVAIDALIAGLHAHPVSDPSYRVGSGSQTAVRLHAESFCIAHAGIGSLYIAHLELTPATATAPVTASLALTASDCRGVLRSQASAVVTDTTPAAAIRRAVSTAVARLGKLPA